MSNYTKITFTSTLASKISKSRYDGNKNILGIWVNMHDTIGLFSVIINGESREAWLPLAALHALTCADYRNIELTAYTGTEQIESGGRYMLIGKTNQYLIVERDGERFAMTKNSLDRNGREKYDYLSTSEVMFKSKRQFDRSKLNWIIRTEIDTGTPITLDGQNYFNAEVAAPAAEVATPARKVAYDEYTLDEIMIGLNALTSMYNELSDKDSRDGRTIRAEIDVLSRELLKLGA